MRMDVVTPNRPTMTIAQVEDDGITVTKDLSIPKESVYGVGLSIESARSVPTMVVVEDVPPDDDTYQAIHLHPDYHPERWQKTGKSMRFVTKLEPEERIQTAYVLTEFEGTAADLPKPTIASVEAYEEGALLRGGQGRSRADGGKAHAEEHDVTDPTSSDSDVTESIELPEPNDKSADQSASRMTNSDPSRKQVDPAPNDVTEATSEKSEGFTAKDGDHSIDMEVVIQSLTEALTRETIDEETLSTLQARLFELFVTELRAREGEDEQITTLPEIQGERSPEHIRVRLERIETQMAELAAYTDALREFIDENGTANEVFDELQSDIEDLSAELASVSDYTHELGNEQSSLRSDVEEVVEDVDEIEAVEKRIDTIETTIDSHEKSLEDLSEDIEATTDSVRSTLEPLSEAVTQTEAELRTLMRVLANTERKVRDLDQNVSDLDAEVDESVADLKGTIDAFEDQTQEIDTKIDNLDGNLRAVGEAFRTLAGNLPEVNDAL